MQVLSNILASVACFQFFYALYKYLFYSADCNPKNSLSLEVNTLLNFIGQTIDFLLWLIPFTIFFWPTKKHLKQ